MAGQIDIRKNPLTINFERRTIEAGTNRFITQRASYNVRQEDMAQRLIDICNTKINEYFGVLSPRIWMEYELERPKHEGILNYKFLIKYEPELTNYEERILEEHEVSLTVDGFIQKFNDRRARKKYVNVTIYG